MGRSKQIIEDEKMTNIYLQLAEMVAQRENENLEGFRIHLNNEWTEKENCATKTIIFQNIENGRFYEQNNYRQINPETGLYVVNYGSTLTEVQERTVQVTEWFEV